MATKDPKYQGLLGNTVGLSHWDKYLVNLMYGCIGKDYWDTVLYM